MSKNKVLIFVVLSAVVFSQGKAQDSLISKYEGYIVNDGKPVTGVSISIDGKRKGVISDEKGYFIIENIASPKIRMHISAIGFEHQSKEVKIAVNHLLDTIILKPVINQLQDIVVSGTMRAVSKMESPIPVEVYTPALFKKNPTPNIFESLTMVNGVQPQLNCNVCNTGDIHINGMEGPYTMILIDGMPIVSALSTVYGLSGIPNSLIKRVEIVKGPASTLYGSEAVGGLINIITKDPLTADRFKLDVSATSIGEYNIDLTKKFAINNASAIIGVNYFNYAQKRDINQDNFTDVALQDRISIFNKWNFTRKRDKNATLAARYIYESRWGGQLQFNKSFRGSNKVYGESIYTNRVELLGNYELSGNLTADLSYNYHLQDSYYGTTKYYATQHVTFAQLRWNKSLGIHNVLAGLPFRYTSYDDNSPATMKDGQNKPSNTILPGLFIQDEIKFSDKITSLAGIRYDYNNQHGSIVTPRLSFKYAPNRNNTVRLSGGNGYRVVNLFTEDHAALTGAREVIIANALKPEQSWNVNFNYVKQIRTVKGLFNVDASMFYTYFTNKIVGDFITDPQKIIYDNLEGFAISKGFTLNTEMDLERRLKVNAGVTLMDVYQVERDNEVENKIPQLFAPKFSGTYAITYTFPKVFMSIDFTGKVNGPMHLPVVPNDFRPEKSPLFSIINLQITKTFGQTWELYGGGKNLLNFIPKNPLLHPDDPFNTPGGKYFDENGDARASTNPNAYTFDPSYNYASVQGLKVFFGVRYTVK